MFVGGGALLPPVGLNLPPVAVTRTSRQVDPSTLELAEDEDEDEVVTIDFPLPFPLPLPPPAAWLPPLLVELLVFFRKSTSCADCALLL